MYLNTGTIQLNGADNDLTLSNIGQKLSLRLPNQDKKDVMVRRNNPAVSHNVTACMALQSFH